MDQAKVLSLKNIENIIDIMPSDTSKAFKLKI